MRSFTRAGAAAMALLALGVSPSVAGALRVSPVGLDLPAGRAAATLTLRNDDEAPMNVQVRVFRWTQGVEGESLVPTDEVVVSPPIAPLAARSERVVRVVRLGPESDRETSYRVVVDQLPPAPGAQGQQVRLLMRHSVPLFFTPAGGAAPKLELTTERGPEGLRLLAVNRGARRVRLANPRLLDHHGREVAAKTGLLGYVLAGSQTAWDLPLEATASAPVRFVADSDVGPIDVILAPRL
ncbi:MAG: fimbria/pilus periplasmic chaperone [Phenylobacterium sp.]|nr:fimbria/pilus periplasmic chaperone [Phenylobacterium sp.]